MNANSEDFGTAVRAEEFPDGGTGVPGDILGKGSQKTVGWPASKPRSRILKGIYKA